MTTPALATVDAAVAIVLDHARPLAPVLIPLDRTLGLVLAEPIVADVDLPPFAKATMDGYAVRSVDVPGPGTHRLRVVTTILAGQSADQPIGSGEAAQIMTGAPLPLGADAVVPVERTTIPPGAPDDVQLDLTSATRPGQFVMPAGRELRHGDQLLDAGTPITPAKVGLIAAAGGPAVRVTPLPSVAVVTTGDELVPAGQALGPGQIRNSNGPMLVAFANRWAGPAGTVATEFPTIPDRTAALVEQLGGLLESSDVLILSGGVSAGVKDLVPAALGALGVEPVFHQVRVKPGKPIWFGIGPRRSADRPGALVFGLPGNPASCVVGFLLFVRPALGVLAGRGAHPAPIEPVRLGDRFEHRGDRPTYHPVRVKGDTVIPLRWAGSADLRTVAQADGFALFPAGDHDHEAGSPVGLLRLH